MNFFERQDAARKTSARLILLFALAVLGIVVAVDVAVLIALAGREQIGGGERIAAVVLASLATVAIIGLGSMYRIASLRGGGETIALQLGGVPVPEQSRDPQLRRLRNVVEEIAIASGVPMPKLYVLEHESGINAFAAGYAPSDAAIAVTRGALERLNRDELQGVIAHEFSHVLNGDMRLNIRLMGVLFGILMLAVIGRKILEHGRFAGRDNKGAGAVLVAALTAMAIGYVGLFFGRLIKAGVSRSRETLADASAVQFTRQTAGLAGALKKIAGLNDGAKLEHRADAEEISHMLFGDGVGLSGMFATHPPLMARIQVLEPSFRADHLLTLHQRWAASPPNGLEEDVRLGLVDGAPAPAAAPPPLPNADARFAVSPPMVAAQVAHPAADDYRRADAIVGAIPESLRALATQRDDVVPLIVGLLLDDDARIQRMQHMEIAARMGRQAADLAVAFRQEHLLNLHPMLRLPLAALAFPVLRLRPRPELGVVLDTVHAVVNTDGHVSAFEYCLGCLLHAQLRESLDPSRHREFGRRKLSEARPQIATLLALIAQAGHDGEDAAKRAYLAGMQRVLPQGHIDYAPPAEGMRALDAVWPWLDALQPQAKQDLVEAVTAAIGHDGRVSVAESELLRTVCAVLHCPLPPMLERG
ncbi:MAG: peptidase M48 Ste24p [Lysobacter sp.]|nr:MAG: peptidase M48 Ste24p [Lysobacter sp.]